MKRGKWFFPPAWLGSWVYWVDYWELAVQFSAIEGTAEVALLIDRGPRFDKTTEVDLCVSNNSRFFQRAHAERGNPSDVGRLLFGSPSF